jgi:CRISPR-associated protein Csb2
MNRSRPGLGLRLEFPEPVHGPLLLGQLSHFGYGIFWPE